MRLYNKLQEYMFFKIFFIALPIFIAMDLAWLGYIARDFYKQQLGYLLSEDVNWYAAGVFYVIFITGLVIFVIKPSVESESMLKALWMGALFGLVTYSTYDLTNHATVKSWPIHVTVIDIIWGSILCATISVTSYFCYMKIFQ